MVFFRRGQPAIVRQINLLYCKKLSYGGLLFLTDFKTVIRIKSEEKHPDSQFQNNFISIKEVICAIILIAIRHTTLIMEERRKDTNMTVDRKVSSIEASFKMENMQFDTECRQRVRNVLTKKVSVADAIAELNRKYDVSAKRRERSRV